MIIVVAVLLGTTTVFSSLTYSRFHDRVQQLRDTGELTSMDDLAYEVENELDDARFYLEEIVAMDVDFSLIPFDEEGNIKTDAESITLFEEFEGKHHAVFEKVRLAASAPEMSIKPFDTKLNDFLVVVDRVQQAIEWKARTKIARRDGQAACEAAIDILRLTGKSEKPFIIDAAQARAFRYQALHILFELIEHDLLSEVAPETMADVFVLLDEPNLEESNLLGSYTSALKNERSVAIYHMLNSNNVFEDRYELDQSKLAQLASKIPGGVTVVAGNALLDQMNKAIADSQAPLTTEFPVDESADDWNILVAFGGDLSAAFVYYRQRFGELVAMNRVIRVLLTLHMTDDATNRDSWTPDYLESLGVPTAATIDPFTGEPMTIKRVDDRWLVYSVGPDHTDDAGDWQRDLRFGGKDLLEEE